MLGLYVLKAGLHDAELPFRSFNMGQLIIISAGQHVLNVYIFEAAVCFEK